MTFRWTLFLALVATLIAPAARGDVKGVAANVTGLFLQIMIHESGHAAMAAGLGWEVLDFRPYPHICGGRLVGGCVHTSTDQPEYEGDGTFNRRRLSESRRIQAAGSMASNLSVLALSPLQAAFRPSGFAGQTLGSLLTYQTYDWIFYVVTDTLTDFQGDWHAVAATLDVPVYYFLAPAALNFYVLRWYREAFGRRPAPPPPVKAQSPAHPTTEVAPPVVFPRLSYRSEDHAVGLRVDFAMELL